MNETKLEKLVTGTREALKNAGASEYHLRVFNCVAKNVERCASENDVSDFTLEFGLSVIKRCYNVLDDGLEKCRKPIYFYCINELYDYQCTGKAKPYYGKRARSYNIPAGFKPTYDSYIQYREKIGIKPRSLVSDRLYLERFYAFLNTKAVNAPDEIGLSLVFSFLEEISSVYERSQVSQNFRTVRYYLKFCYDDGIMSENLFPKLPNISYCRQSKLPSVYTADEVKKLLGSVDLGNPCGKRNYAIILLISRSGLRASDVADLRFSDIDWEDQRIKRFQIKTGKPINIPLLNDVGDAIIDYLKHSRPENSESDHIFVKHKPPYSHFGSSAVGTLVRRQIQQSGTRIENRRCGSHALRHSLAGRLLECSVPMPVISEILGHTDTKTTMTYLRIDIEQLKTCALEVEICE